MTVLFASQPPLAAAPPPFAPASQGAYTVALAREEEQVRAAQRLRREVFSSEFGVRLTGDRPDLDSDWFDAFCDHLVVTENSGGRVVGTYRLLPPAGARAAGRRYAETEFDLRSHADLAEDLVEAGRSCVHPDHRDGAVIALMWAGIARYLVDNGHNWLAGCCSVPLGDGGELARAVQLRTNGDRYLAPAPYRVTPLRPWAHSEQYAGDQAGNDGARPAAPRNNLPPLPALLRGYLRLGAWVCGPPAYDQEFDVADFYVLLSLRDMNPRYLRHFLGLTAA